MGWFHVLVGAAGAYGFFSLDRPVLMWVQIALSVCVFWTYGVMHNCAVESAKRRASYTGGFYDLTPADLDAVPDRLAQLNMVASLAALALAVASAVLAIWR